VIKIVLVEIGLSRPRRVGPPSTRRKRYSRISRDRGQRPNLPQHNKFCKCKHERWNRTHIDSLVFLYLVACEMVQIATCSRRDLAHALQNDVLTTSSSERAQAIGRALDIGQQTTQYCACYDRTEI
jgi:hypothetical protein